MDAYEIVAKINRILMVKSEVVIHFYWPHNIVQTCDVRAGAQCQKMFTNVH